MLPRSKRLSTSLFKNVIASGKIAHSPLFLARFLKSAGPSKFSAVISKKTAKTAVERNKLRRRIYSSLATLEAKIVSDFHIIIIAKPPLSKSTIQVIKEDLEALFVKTGLLK